MAQLADQRRLGDEHALEQHHFLARHAGRVDHLDRDVALAELVARQVHDAGRAGPELPQEPVLADRAALDSLANPHLPLCSAS